MVPQDIIQPTQPSVSKPEHVTAFVQKWHVAFEMRITTTPNESKGLVHAGWPPPHSSCTPTPPGKHAGTADTFVEAGRLSSPLGRLPDALAGLRLHSAGGNHRASIRPLDFSESAPHKQHNRTQHNREDCVSKLVQWLLRNAPAAVYAAQPLIFSHTVAQFTQIEENEPLIISGWSTHL